MEKGSSPVVGRRERKRAATRRAIADAALELFLAHEFRKVSIKQVAEAADVAVATVFAHFPSKEALLFDEEDGFEDALCSAVADRSVGTSALAALETFLRGAPGVAYAGSPEFAAFRALAEKAPELRAYWRSTWTRHAAALARVLSAPPDPLPEGQAAVVARFALEAVDLAVTAERPQDVLTAAFAVLRRGTG